MYKNHIFDPLNLSLIGEKNTFIEKKRLDFSLDSFKSKFILIYIMYSFFNLVFVTTLKCFSFYTCGICGPNLDKIYVVCIYHRFNMDI